MIYKFNFLNVICFNRLSVVDVGISPQEMKRSTEETEEKEQGQQTSKSSIEETEEEEQGHQTGKSKYERGGGAGSPNL